MKNTSSKTFVTAFVFYGFNCDIVHCPEAIGLRWVTIEIE